MHPRYARQPLQEAPQPLLDYLVRHVREIEHFTPDQIAATSREEAQQMLDAY